MHSAASSAFWMEQSQAHSNFIAHLYARIRESGAASTYMFAPLARNAIPATPARFVHRF